MLKVLAIFKDSLRETLDSRTFWVLLFISGILILICWSLSFDPLAPGEALKDIAGGFNEVMVPRPGRIFRAGYPVKFEVEDPAETAEGRFHLRLRVSPVKEFHRLARHWDALVRDRIRKPGDPVPDLEEPADFELERRFLLARFREQGLGRVAVEAEGETGEIRLYRVEFKPSRPEILRGAHRMGVFFGAVRIRLATSAADVVAKIQSFLADLIAGWVGIILALVVTASFVPDMLQKGRIDLLLSRPIGRPALMASRYLGGLLFVLLHAAFLIGGCWLALAVRSRHWDASFLWSIPVLTAAFAVLHSFSTWMGVLTQSAVASLLTTLGLWFASFAVGFARRLFLSAMAPAELPPWARRGLEAVYYVLPKTSDLKAINNYLIARGNLGPEGVGFIEQMGVVPLDWAPVLISSAVFLAFCLTMACLSFSRRDY